VSTSLENYLSGKINANETAEILTTMLANGNKKLTAYAMIGQLTTMLFHRAGKLLEQHVAIITLHQTRFEALKSVEECGLITEKLHETTHTLLRRKWDTCYTCKLSLSFTPTFKINCINAFWDRSEDRENEAH